MAAAQRDDLNNDPRLMSEDLPAGAARVFRLLPVHPGPDLRTTAVSALADLPVAEAAAALRFLQAEGLVEAIPVGGGRWRLSGVARARSGEIPRPRAAGDDWEEAAGRLLRYYQIASEAADGKLQGRPPIPVRYEFDDREGALAWLDDERANLVALTRMAADIGRDYPAKNLPLLIAHYLGFRRRFDDLMTVVPIGLEAARRLGDQAAEGESLHNMGNALAGLGRRDEALAAYRQAAAVFRGTGDRSGEETALKALNRCQRSAVQG